MRSTQMTRSSSFFPRITRRLSIFVALATFGGGFLFASTQELASTPSDSSSAAASTQDLSTQNSPVVPQDSTEPIDSFADPTQNPDILLGVDAYMNGDFARSAECFQKAYAANPDSDPPGVFLALLHSNSGRFLEMRRALESAAEDCPNDPEAFLQLAGIDVREGRYLEAELLLDRADQLNDEYATLFPKSTSRIAYLREEALTVRANLAERRGRFDAAAAFVQQIVDANPSNVQARWNLGYLAVKRNKLDDAQAAFDAAAKLDPENWRGWLQVATALDRDDRIEEARERLATQTDAIENGTKSERAQLARLYMRWNMIAEAAEIVEKIESEGDANDVDRWILLAWLALYANRYDVAEENFRNAYLLDKSNFEASNGLALALLDQSDREKLAQATNIAAENYRLYPNSQEAAATYAWTLFLSGKTQESNEIFGPMLNSGNITATIAYYLAEIANVRGDQSLALNLLDLALEGKTNFPKRAAAVELRELVESAEDLQESDESAEDLQESDESAESQESDERGESVELVEPQESDATAVESDADVDSI